MKPTLLPAMLCLILGGSTLAARPEKSSAASAKPGYESTVFDFGHVGIEYTVYHRYPLVNLTGDTLRILSVTAHCDCSSAIVPDSVLAPGDSTTVNLRFNTKNFYGPQTKSITVTTDNPALQSIDYFYLSIIGQWFNGLRPKPEAVFFLPAHAAKRVTIPNVNYDQISLSGVSQLDNGFDVKVVTAKAARNQALEIEIAPNKDAKSGTLHSNVTLAIDCGEPEPTILTIPVKIVRY